MKKLITLLLLALLPISCTTFKDPKTPDDYKSIIEIVGQYAGVAIETWEAMSPEEQIAFLEDIKVSLPVAFHKTIDDYIAKLKGEGVDPVDPTDPPADKEGDELFFTQVRWLKRDTIGATAKVTTALTNVRLNGDRLSFDALDIPSWGPGPLGGDLVGVMCVAAMRDGQWSGGKFEHIRNRMTTRDLINIKNGYISGLSLRKGEALKFWILSYDGQKASNVVELTY